MAERVTIGILDRSVDYLSRYTGVKHRLEGAYGRWRLVDESRGHDITPLRSKRELYDFIKVYEKGFDLGKRQVGHGS